METISHKKHTLCQYTILNYKNTTRLLDDGTNSKLNLYLNNLPNNILTMTMHVQYNTIQYNTKVADAPCVTSKSEARDGDDYS